MIAAVLALRCLGVISRPFAWHGWGGVYWWSVRQRNALGDYGFPLLYLFEKGDEP